MQNIQMEKKQLAVIAGIVVTVLVVVIAGVLLLRGKETAYRSVEIYNLEGTAVIYRDSIGEIAAQENLMLQSGDTVEVGKDSTVRLKLDDDKYVLAEENTVFELVAEGTSEESKTVLMLQQGAITSEISNPLERSSYEVSTPNSVMAVRGTIFRVSVVLDTDGKAKTTVTTMEGVVSASLIHPDGTLAEDEVLVERGYEISIASDAEQSYYEAEPEEVSISDLPLAVLEFLNDNVKNGADIGITPAELDEIITAKKVADETETPEEIAVDMEEADTELPPEGKPDTGLPQSKDKSGDADPQGKKTESTEKTEKTEKTGSKDTEVKDTVPENPNNTPAICKVTFIYEGSIFGMQEVLAGNTVQIPTLAPDAAGGWDYDFSKPVTSDLKIMWKKS